ncbi:MAG TPA: hypothetical protein ENK18_03045 [Deltaproteobacteria bacterium]|nr:hypothetical protein [Deltaproteobacteria bacterium]
MVLAPRNSVSSVPRLCIRRSVKVCPRCRSPASWTSSTARNATGRSVGIASTVQIQYRASDPIRFSSPVIRATTSGPRRSTTRS